MFDEDDGLELHRSNYDTDIIVKKLPDILDECNFKTKDEYLLCEDIIRSLESFAANSLKNDKIITLPYIGTTWKNKLAQFAAENKNMFKAYRKNTNKEEYIEFCRKKFNEEKDRLAKDDKSRLEFIKFKTLNKRQYDKYAREYGIDIANVYFYKCMKLKVVPFDEEVEEILNDAYEK